MDLEFTSESMPLISFHALVDEDVGVFKFILANYRESSAINMDLLKNKSTLEIIGDIYKRKFDNPLKLIMSEEKYSDLLDRCYQELITEHEADIIEHSVTTEFLNLVVAFNESKEITPTIMCYTQEQYNIIVSIEALKGIKVVGVKEALSNLNKLNISGNSQLKNNNIPKYISSSNYFSPIPQKSKKLSNYTNLNHLEIQKNNNISAFFLFDFLLLLIF